MKNFKEFLAEQTMINEAQSTYQAMSDDELKAHHEKFKDSTKPEDRTRLNAAHKEMTKRGFGPENKLGKAVGSGIQKMTSRRYANPSPASADSELTHIADHKFSNERSYDHQKKKFTDHITAASNDKTNAGIVVKKGDKIVSTIHRDTGSGTKKQYTVTDHTGAVAKEPEYKHERVRDYSAPGRYKYVSRTYHHPDLSSDEAYKHAVVKHGEGDYSIHAIKADPNRNELSNNRSAQRNVGTPSDKVAAVSKFVDKHLGAANKEKLDSLHKELDSHVAAIKSGKIDRHTKNNFSKIVDDIASAHSNSATADRVKSGLHGTNKHYGLERLRREKEYQKKD